MKLLIHSNCPLKSKKKCIIKEAAFTQTHARVVFTKETTCGKDVTISCHYFTVSLAILLTNGVNNLNSTEILHLHHSGSFVLWISSLFHALIKVSHNITASFCCFKIKCYKSELLGNIFDVLTYYWPSDNKMCDCNIGIYQMNFRHSEIYAVLFFYNIKQYTFYFQTLC